MRLEVALAHGLGGRLGLAVAGRRRVAERQHRRGEGDWRAYKEKARVNKKDAAAPTSRRGWRAGESSEVQHGGGASHI